MHLVSGLTESEFRSLDELKDLLQERPNLVDSTIQRFEIGQRTRLADINENSPEVRHFEHQRGSTMTDGWAS